MKRRSLRRLAWFGVGFGLLLMLPNCGPLAAARYLMRHAGNRVSTTVGQHGRFDIVGYSVLMFDHVGIQVPSLLPFWSDEVLRVSGGRKDLFPRDVEITETDHGIRVLVHDNQEPPLRLELSDRELSLLRWFGPRTVVAGELLPLWTWLDAGDGLAVLLVFAPLLWTRRRQRRPAREPAAEAKLLAPSVATERQLWFLDLGWSGSFASPAPGQEFCMLLAVGDETTAEERRALARRLVEQGCRCAVCWGEESDDWRSAIDAAGAEGDASCIVTATSHAFEPLSEVVAWFRSCGRFEDWVPGFSIVVVVRAGTRLQSRIRAAIRHPGTIACTSPSEN